MVIRSVYLSARYARREELLVYRRSLTMAGIACTARWLDGEGDDMAVNAQHDVDDVKRADMLVNFTEEPLEHSPLPFVGRGGRHVELGIALALGREVLVVGPRENIFHHLPSVYRVPTWAAALRWIRARAEMTIS